MIRATARLQFHRGFAFDHAIAIVPYLARLGISHVYASPILTALPGSAHGYDTIDYGEVNPELGGEPGLRRLVAALREHAMGLVVDIVPNHMHAGPENPWWHDVLVRGARSRYAGHFDIDWSPWNRLLRGKLLLPVLGRPYAEALAAGELQIVRDAGGAHLQYFAQRFPLIGVRADDTDVHAVLERQHYRLAWWRTAADEINWRRFFEITTLAGLRVQRPRVFEAVHAKIFALYAEGLVDGLRVDHVDGLADPQGYCRRLRRRLRTLRPGRPWIVVEKILGPDERLPADWRADGTTGYDFMYEVGALLHDAAGEAALEGLWREASGSQRDYADELRAARGRLLTRHFGAEWDAAARAFRLLALREPAARDFSLAAIRRALLELLLQFPVYRVYAGGDQGPLRDALERAGTRLLEPDRSTLAWIGRCLLEDHPATRPARVRLAQLTAPLAAKAVEDTAFYRYGRALALNEVGSDPGRFALPAAEFHQRCQRRAGDFPATLLATATHDHKRGEDMRARLAVLSELPDEWRAAVVRWRARNAGKRAEGPDDADEYMLYQTLAGSWPLGDAEAGYHERVDAWLRKSLRESKRHTDWLEPDKGYEKACGRFLRVLLADAGFVAELRALAERLALPGVVNTLTQTFLRLTTPGIPDLYQGTDLWDFSLVDPDNRRPVDFDLRARMLDAETPLAPLLADWRDGRIKQALIARVLAFRHKHPQLFARGSYEPLEVQGPLAGHALAFARQWRGTTLVAIATLHSARLLHDGLPRITPAAWGDTALPFLEGRRAMDVLTGAAHAGGQLKHWMEEMPVALLTVA